jgi:hypothetical protein
MAIVLESNVIVLVTLTFRRLFVGDDFLVGEFRRHEGNQLGFHLITVMVLESNSHGVSE